MGSNPTGFKVSNSTAGWNEADFEDIFVRKDCFLEGGLWVWGFNNSAALGTNSLIAQSSPVQTISGGTNWRSVSLGGNHSAAIKTDGTLWLWGTGSVGQLGTNSTIRQSSPVQTISGGNNWRSVSIGNNHSAAIKTDGSLWLWGTGGAGTLGNNSTINQSSPVQTISGGNDWKRISFGCSHSAAIKTDGTLWLWGQGICGELGNNTTLNRSSPVQTISGGTNWRSVSLGWVHTAAIKTDGSLWLWGRNVDGQLGASSPSAARSSPIQTISGGTNWRSIFAGRAHNISIKTDGTLWSWGCNRYGQLGNNSTTTCYSPVQTITGGSDWRNISASGMVSSAIKTDGTLWQWGRNGRLGDNLAIDRSSPVQTISGGTNWRSVSIGYVHSAAIRENCW